jgi:hypothetical protein
MKPKAPPSPKSSSKRGLSTLRQRIGGLALPEVVVQLLKEGILEWEPSDKAYIVTDGESFEFRYCIFLKQYAIDNYIFCWKLNWFFPSLEVNFF